MKLRWFAVAVLATWFGLGCSPDSEPQIPSTSPPSPFASSPREGMDTLRAALSERNELERKYLLTSFLRKMRPDDVESVLKAIEDHRTGITQDDVRLIMLAWTRFDGPGAYKVASEWPTRWKSVLMEEAIAAWGYNDGPAALAEAAKIEDQGLRAKFHSRALSGWVSSGDRQEVTAFAANEPNARRRGRLAFRLAGQAKRDGPDAIIAWAEGVPDDLPNKFKVDVFGHACGTLTTLDPKRATQWYESQMKHWYSEACLGLIANKWSREDDSDAVITWVMSLPVEEARESERTDAVRKLFRNWSPKNPEAAEAWLKSAPAGPARDEAVDEFAKSIAEASPSEALEWVRQMTDEKQRKYRSLRYTRMWFERNPEAAMVWIAAADLDSAERKAILNNLPTAKRSKKSANAQPGG